MKKPKFKIGDRVYYNDRVHGWQGADVITICANAQEPKYRLDFCSVVFYDKIGMAYPESVLQGHAPSSLFDTSAIDELAQIYVKIPNEYRECLVNGKWPEEPQTPSHCKTDDTPNPKKA